ncbi:hypothetical protein MKUB_45520 [Mycobacterium kubicae]|uniref:Transposase IS110-like N-terminal domain-containing protein n=1 Tax=Mycobacterium kubicae TaxID=120959 RepID=A0ABQ1BTJ6_9MYCO|nr:hypothetical protein MKUB_45520 [Mycobacterium kubicae]
MSTPIKTFYAAAVVDVGGALLATASFGADREGYRALIEWAAQFGTVLRFGIEGTGSYGRGLASAVRRHGHEVIEVARPNRQDRHRRGKSLPSTPKTRCAPAGDTGQTPTRHSCIGPCIQPPHRTRRLRRPTHHRRQNQTRNHALP